MTSTDERVVKMKFDNAEFKKNALDTKSTLDNVNKAMDATGKNKGLLDMNSNMQRVQVTASKMAVITTTALATITNKVVNTGLQMAKSLTFDPIKQGFSEYEAMLTKQNVIQNATGKSAKEVKGFLNQLNTYSDKTVYSFGNMTDAIQKFVNAGVPLKTSVTSIKGIANAAAFAGASSEEANRAMYAFSQSMSLGFIQLQDWNQIENANLGTVKFKNTLLEAGLAAGTLTRKGDGFVTKSGKFVSATKGWRDGLQEQWATTKVLNTALGKYADTNTKLGKKAFQAATQVRTFSAFMDTLKESLGSGWSQIFTALIGNLGQSTRMWTGLSQAVGGVVGSFFNFATKTVKVWRRMGGFEKTLQGFKNLLAPVGAILTTIGDAWQIAFPSGGRGAGKTLYAVSSGFEAITRPLQIVADLIHFLTQPLAVFFGILHIGGSAVQELAGWVGDLVGKLFGLIDIKAPSKGGFLGFVMDIGKEIAETVGQIDHLLSRGKSLKQAFGKVDINLPNLPNMPDFGGGGKAASGGASRVSAMAAGVKDLAKQIFGLGDANAALDDVQSGLATTGDKVSSVGAKMGDILKSVVGWIGDIVSKINLKDVMASFNLAILGTMALAISKFLNGLGDAFEGFAGVGPAFTGVLESTGKSLEGFAKAAQRQAMAKVILNVAIAVGILAASLWVLSKIPADKLATSLVAMGAVFLMLNATMKNFTKLVNSMDGAKMSLNIIALSVGIVALALAMILLATACLIMNKVEWQSIAKGLGTMYVAMKLMESLGNLGKDAAKNMVAGGLAIALMAASMIVLAGALLLFQLVKWESIGKAGVVLAGLTLAVAALALIPYQGIAKVGLALLTASLGMLAMANALILFGLVKWGSIAKAAVVLAALTLSLAVIVALGGPASAVSMLALAGALVAVAGACLIFNHVDWESIAKATVALTILLLAFAVGAAILTVFLYAITPVAPVLIILAAGFFLLGLGLLAFAAAMAIAITLGAAGVAAFAALATGAAVAVAVFMQTLAAEAPILKDSFLAILQALIDTIVEAVPMIIQGVKDLWNAVKKEFTSPDKGKATGDAGKSWMEKLGDGIEKMLPKIAAIGVKLFGKFLNVLDDHLPELLTMGLYFVQKLIEGIAGRIGGIVKAAADLIIAFIQAISKQAPRVADAGAKAIIDMINAMADSIERNSEELTKAMVNLGTAMVRGLIKGVTDMADDALGAIGGLAEGMVNKAKSILKIFSPSRVFRDIGKFLVEGLTGGVQDNAAAAISSVASMVSGQIAVANEYLSKFIQGLDQKTVAAQAKASGLRLAAERALASADKQSNAADKAETAANKTKKDKKDDKVAKRKGKAADKAAKAAKAIERKADKADKLADKAAARSEAAKAAQDRREKFDNAAYLEKAQMRSEDAQNQLDASKAAEGRAERDRLAAAELDKQAKAKGVTPAQRKALEKQADALRKQAKEEAKRANELLASAKSSAADALKYQTLSGEEAARLFQEQFDAEAKAAADAEAFEKLSAKEKAKRRREDAAALQAKAAADLEAAKKLAFTDLEAANELAEKAMDEADLARQYVDDAKQFEEDAGTDIGTSSGPANNGTVISLVPGDAAAAAFDQYSALYDAAYAAAAASGPKVEFNQYNTSPESLSEIQIYRQTDNLVTYAVDRLAPAS